VLAGSGILTLAAPAAAQPLLPFEFRAPGPGEVAPGSFPQAGGDATTGGGGGSGAGDRTLGAFAAPFASPFGDAARPAAGPLGPTRAYNVTPGLGLRLLGTDNVFNSASGRQSDLVTFIEPRLAAEADSLLVTGRLFYAPSARIYADNNTLNALNHSFSGQALATLIPGRLFLNLQGTGGLQAIGGGFAPAGVAGTLTNSRNLAQTYSLSASPYYIQRFGDLGLAQLGYTLSYFGTQGSRAFLPSPVGATGTPAPFFTTQDTISNTGYAVFRTGDAFGRFGAEWRTTGTVFSGSGTVLSGGHRLISTVQTSYSITRQLAVLVEAGYENQHYGGSQPLDIDGPVWSVGARFTPDPDSVLTVKYGFRNGFYSASVNGNLALGARTRAFASYSEQLGTQAQQATDLLSGASVDALGNPINTLSGTPIIAPFGGSLLATQSSLQRTKLLTAGVAQGWERDTFGLNVFYNDRTPVTTLPGTTSFAQSGWSVGLSWTRELRPTLVGSLFGSYGRTETPATASQPRATDSNVYTVRLSLAQALARDLTLSFDYLFTSNSQATFGTVPGSAGNTTTNIVILALRKTF
jgi:hypothetical protein